MRTLTISNRSWFLRAFVWTWGADPKSLNICKLFWGTLFFPVGFCYLKPAWRFIPRISFSYCALGLIFLSGGYWKSATLDLGLASFMAILGYLKIPAIYHENTGVQSERLTKITERGELVLIWLEENIISPPIDFIHDFLETRDDGWLRRVLRPIVNRLRSLKRTACPYVQVIER